MGEYMCNVCRRRVCAGHGESRESFLKHLIGDIKVLMASCLSFHIACDLLMVYFCFCFILVREKKDYISEYSFPRKMKQFYTIKRKQDCG